MLGIEANPTDVSNTFCKDKRCAVFAALFRTLAAWPLILWPAVYCSLCAVPSRYCIIMYRVQYCIFMCPLHNVLLCAASSIVSLYALYIMYYYVPCPLNTHSQRQQPTLSQYLPAHSQIKGRPLKFVACLV